MYGLTVRLTGFKSQVFVFVVAVAVVGVGGGGGGVCMWFFKTEFFCVMVLAVLASAL